MKPHIAYNLRGRQSIAQKNMSDERNNCVRAMAARMVDERPYITLESRIFYGKNLVVCPYGRTTEEPARWSR